MKIVVAYKWTSDPEEASVGADGTVDWSRARPGISTYDPVAIEVARGLAAATGAELIGVTVGAKGVGTPLAAKAALSRGLDRVVIVEDDSLKGACEAELARGGLRRDPPHRRRRPGDHRRLVGGRRGQDGADRAGRRVGWPAVAEVTDVTGQPGALRVGRAVPGGAQVLEISGPAVLATSADATTPHVPGMKDLLAAGKKPVEHVDLAALDVPASGAVITITGRARPARKERKNQLLDTSDPAAAAAELVKALREVGAL